MIRIVVDSSSDYQPEELKEKNLELVPLVITIGETNYVEGRNLERNQFYEILERTGEFPKTSQPSPQDFLDIFEDAKEKGDEVVCILLSSALSGTCQSAILAKGMADYDKIYIVDSLAATYMIRIMADFACRLRKEGVSAKEIRKAVEKIKSKIRVLAALNTLEYLSRGGRISKTTAAIGNMANIKPIITVTRDGEVGMEGKCLGKNKAVSYLLKQLDKYEMDSSFPFYTLYSYGIENCKRLEEKLTEEGIRVSDRLQLGATIGAHIGPEAFGIIFVCK